MDVNNGVMNYNNNTMSNLFLAEYGSTIELSESYADRFL